MNSEVYSLLILKFANQITIQSTGHNIIQRPLRVAVFRLLPCDWSVVADRHQIALGRERLGTRKLFA